VFWFDGQRHRRLLKRIRFEEEPQADGITRRVATTWTAGLDGQLQLASREIETTRSTASDSLRQETTRFVAGINRRMEEAERTEYEERTLPTGLVEFKSAWLQRDVNGRWRAIETRKGRFHQAGVSTGVDEGRLYWRDADGNLALRERTSTRRSEVDGNEQVEIEIYSEDPVRFAGDTRLRLGERVRRTTTVGSDGHTRIVEDVEARNPVAPADALRVVRQTVTTVRDEGNHRITERRVFERDPNGRLVPFVTDVEEEVR
jgi:hypothetical protein